MLEALYKKYCPKAHSKCSTATARMKWHTDLTQGFKQELRVVVDRGRDSLEFSAEELLDLLCQTNESAVKRVLHQAKKRHAIS
jgi:hypothetical protein